VNLKTAEDLNNSDRPALRGGSWDGPANFARASVRYGFCPDNWLVRLGFRVVLSLAE
jgi:formylglycine-generating enzyme required for sulfatase activity